MADEPLTVSDGDRRHLAGCARCRGRYDQIAADAREAESFLAVPAVQIDTSAALARLQGQLAAGPAPDSRRSWGVRRPGRFDLLPWRRRLVAPAAGLATAAALLGALTLTPAGGLAQQFITIFQPTQVTVVPITTGELQALPDLQKFGTVQAPTRVQPRTEPDRAAAEAATSMHVLAPTSLPGGVPKNATYQVMPGQTGSFTFSAAKAAQTAAADGTALPPMPAKVDGSTIQITTGDAVLATYGDSASSGGLPALVIGQMKAPRVSSSGASLKDLEDYMLKLPGVSPQLAAEIRSIGDPSSTLPIPVPVTLAHEHPVQVQGVSGAAIGDSTGIGSLLIWEKDGVIYGVGGTLSESQVLDVANSLG
jgi:hypothetical protein